MTDLAPTTLFDRTIIIGAGGTGGCLVPQLLRLLQYHPAANLDVQLWDGDTFEAHNLERQLCNEQQLDNNKAKAVAEICQTLGLQVRPRASFIGEAALKRQLNNVRSVLVICAVDNNATRTMSLQVLEQSACDYFWITPGNADDADGTKPIRGQALWSGRLRTQDFGLRLEDLLSHYPELKEDAEPMPTNGGCSHKAPSAPQLLASNMLAAATTLAIIQNVLDGTLVPHQHASYFQARGLLNAATV